LPTVCLEWLWTVICPELCLLSSWDYRCRHTASDFLKCHTWFPFNFHRILLFCYVSSQFAFT
jgi:hypothetical protein